MIFRPITIMITWLIVIIIMFPLPLYFHDIPILGIWFTTEQVLHFDSRGCTIDSVSQDETPSMVNLVARKATLSPHHVSVDADLFDRQPQETACGHPTSCCHKPWTARLGTLRWKEKLGAAQVLDIWSFPKSWRYPQIIQDSTMT